MVDGGMTALDRIVRSVGGFRLLLIIGIVVLLFMFSFGTRWIPASKKINETMPDNKTVELEGIYSYAHDDYIAKTNQFEMENALIPKSSFEFEKAIILIIMVIILLVTSMQNKMSTEPLPIEKIEPLATAYLEREMALGKIQKFDTPMKCYLRKRQIDDGKLIPQTWYLPVSVHTQEGQPEYHLLGFNPFSGKLENDLPRERDFDGRDICPQCGLYYNVKVQTPAGFTQWRDTYGERKK